MATVQEIILLLRGDKTQWDATSKAVNAEADKLGRKKIDLKVNVDAVTALGKFKALEAANLKVASAEQRLGELREKVGVKTSTLTRAESGLASAQTAAYNALTALDREVDSGTKKLDRHTKATRDAHVGLLGLAAVLGPVVVPLLAGLAAGGVGAAAGLGVMGLALIGARQAMKAGTDTGKAFSGSLGMLKQDLAVLAGTAAAGSLGAFQAATQGVHAQLGPLNDIVAKLAPAIGSGLSGVVAGLVSLMVRLGPLAEQVAAGFSHGGQAFASWAQNGTGPSKIIAYMSAELPKVVDFVESMAKAIGHIVIAAGPLGGITLQVFTLLAKAISSIPLPILQVLVPTLVGLGLAIKAMAVAEVVSAKVLKLNTALYGLAGAEAAAGTASVGLLGALGRLGIVAAAVFLAVNGTVQNAQDKIGPLAGRQAEVADEALKLIAGSVHQTTDQVRAGVSGTDAAFQAYLGTLGNVSTVTKDMLNGLHDKLGQTAAATTTLTGTQAQARVTIDGVSTSITKETTASGLLAAALTRLNGGALNLETTEDNFRSTLNGLTKAHDAHTSSISRNSAASLANRQVLVSAIQAANQHAQAVADETAKTHSLSTSVAAGVSDFRRHETAIRNAAAAAGLDKAQVDALIASLGRIPKSITSNVITHFITEGHQPGTQGKLVTAASGGLVTGPGTGTSDSISARVSAGEYIMPADVTAKYLPQLKAMRAGTSTLPSTGGYRAGGMWSGGDTYVSYYVTVQGSVIRENDLVNNVIGGIDQRRRRKGLHGVTDSPGAQLRVPALDTEAVIQ
jgi:hypothetical protein